MRLWHKDLLINHVLPKQQLSGQWRECILILKALSEKGTPNHILVNRVTEYEMKEFIQYCSLVSQELKRTGRQITSVTKSKIKAFCDQFNISVEDVVPNEELYKNWHNDIYLRECLYNLEEKFICGGISVQEWQGIYELYHDRFDLVKTRG